jgi:hypothetical protein
VAAGPGHRGARYLSGVTFVIGRLKIAATTVT